MKNYLLLFVIAIVFVAAGAGCVGPRTGSVGYRNTQPVLTTNLVGTVTSQQVGEQPPVVYAQTNFTVVSTPPVQNRTWREKALGQRPPADVRVVPPFPNAGVYGVAPATVTVPQGAAGAVAPQTGGARYGQSPVTGAWYLLPSNSSYGTRAGTWNGAYSNFRGGLREFFLPTIYGRGSGASIAVSAHTWGRVNVPVTRFERKARGHAASIGTLPRGGYPPYYGGSRATTYTAGVVAVGGGTVVSGLALPRR